jgi:hypothetical protein
MKANVPGYEYYRQELVGLTAPGWDQILPVLFVRSVLFLAASLPGLSSGASPGARWSFPWASPCLRSWGAWG